MNKRINRSVASVPVAGWDPTRAISAFFPRFEFPLFRCSAYRCASLTSIVPPRDEQPDFSGLRAKFQTGDAESSMQLLPDGVTNLERKSDAIVL
jgi:hypothetical protein